MLSERKKELELQNKAKEEQNIKRLMAHKQYEQKFIKKKKTYTKKKGK